jgi:ferredoxin--NADP+ reductase/benzoate/toluate 1,2-dioxygenase reductase subunit
MLTATKIRYTGDVQEVRRLTGETIVLRIDRGNIDFEPGQYVRIGVDGDSEIRDYSIYSGNDKPYIEVLLRRVEDGLVSKQLFDLKEGDRVMVGGPYGHFKLLDSIKEKPLLFIATGTGISPYRSFIESYDNLNYKLIHGTSYLNEAYEKEIYGDKYFHCVSREKKGDFNGRVTDYIKNIDFSSDTNAFLCGNCDMIYDVFDLLQERGLPTGQIHTEVYF